MVEFAALPEPTRDDLRDEISTLATALVERHGMTSLGIRKVVRAALRKKRARPIPPILGGMRIATAEDYLADLERAALAVGNARVAMNAVSRGLKAVDPTQIVPKKIGVVP